MTLVDKKNRKIQSKMPINTGIKFSDCPFCAAWNILFRFKDIDRHLLNAWLQGKHNTAKGGVPGTVNNRTKKITVTW